MNKNQFRCLTTLALFMAGAGHVVAQGVPLVSTPASVSFDISSSAPASADVQVTRGDSGGAAVVQVTSQTPLGVSCVPLNATTVPFTLRITVTPSQLPAGTASSACVITGAGFAPLTIPISFTGAVGSGTPGFTVSPSALTFTQTGTTVPAAQTLTITNTAGIQYYPTVVWSNGTPGWFTITPPPQTYTTSTVITVTPIAGLVTGTYSAYLYLIPQNTAYASVTIPLTLNVNQTSGTSSLSASPTTVVFSVPTTTTTPVSQTVTVTSGITTTFTAQLSSILTPYMTVAATGTTPAVLTLTIPSPNLLPATGLVGTLTLTPVTGGQVLSIPVQVNAGYLGGGTGTLQVSPTTLTFTGPVGSTTAPPVQYVSVSSSDLTPQPVSVTASSTNNFLTTSTLSTVTPTNIAVSVNLAAITTPGTYTGTITITPLSGTGLGIPNTVTVSLVATASITVTPGTNAVSLTAPAGSTSVVQQNVYLGSSVNGATFTTTATTTSGGSWLSATSQTGGLLPGNITVTANPAGLAPGTYQGSIVVTAQGITAATLPVTLVVTPSGTLQVSPATLTFNYQTNGSAAAPSQTVQISSSSGTLNWTATATSTGGWLQVSPASGTTGQSATVSVNPTGLSVGVYTGSVSISSNGAGNSPVNVNVTLNVTTPAVPVISSVTNSATNSSTFATPGLIVAIFGSNLGPANPAFGQVTNGRLGTSIGDLQVLFDGIAAPIIYASAAQINAVVPYEVYGRVTTHLIVSTRGQQSRELELRVSDSAAGLFTTSGSGTGQAAALNQNGSVNNINNPESRGNVIVLYATGGGQTNPAGTTGLVATSSDLRRPQVPVVVRINGLSADILYAGSAPGLISGAMQINVRIPQNALQNPAAGPTNVPVEIQIGNSASTPGAVSQPGATIAIF